MVMVKELTGMRELNKEEIKFLEKFSNTRKNLLQNPYFNPLRINGVQKLRELKVIYDINNLHTQLQNLHIKVIHGNSVEKMTKKLEKLENIELRTLNKECCIL